MPLRPFAPGGCACHFQELVDAGSLLGRDADHGGLAAPLLGHQPVLGQLLLCALRVGALLVHLRIVERGFSDCTLVLKGSGLRSGSAPSLVHLVATTVGPVHLVAITVGQPMRVKL